MSHTTAKLISTLHQDLRSIFDPFQLSVIEAGGDLWPDATPQQAQAYYLSKSLVKKYNDERAPTKRQCDNALKKFLAVNDRCGKWVYAPEDWREEELWLLLKQEIYDFWYHADQVGSIVDSLEQLVLLGGVGKGASAKARAPDFYTKLFDSPLSYTKNILLVVWQKATASWPHWANSEKTRSNRYGSALVAGNKLSFVNKNVDTARCISTEATINMWFQKGIGNAIEDRLIKRYGIDLSTQPRINGKLAEIGSIKGSYSTIDLESASDSISNRLLSQLLPRGMLAWLNLTRSEHTALPGNRLLALDMVATMGNGFCFPLQTLIFSSIVRAVYKFRGIPLKGEFTSGDPRGKTFGVFGDDIIVTEAATSDVLRLLRVCGFVVNQSKTHVEGPFRESCGADFHLGTPVRGVYIKTLRTAQAHYVAINTLNRWSAMTGIRLQNTVGYLRSCVSIAAPLVPPDEDDTAGIHVPSDLVRGNRRGPHGIWRYRKDAPVPAKIRISGSSKFNVWIEPGKTLGGTVINRKVNLAGLLISFLGGYVTGATRHEEASFLEASLDVSYRTKSMTTPCWDYFPTKMIKITGAELRPSCAERYSFADWSSAVAINLSVEC